MKSIVFNVTSSGLVDSNSYDQAYFVNATSGALTRTLPDATICRGARRTVAKTDASVNVVIVNTTSSQTITGVGGAVTSKALAAQGNSITVVSDGAGWIITSTT